MSKKADDQAPPAATIGLTEMARRLRMPFPTLSGMALDGRLEAITGPIARNQRGHRRLTEEQALQLEQELSRSDLVPIADVAKQAGKSAYTVRRLVPQLEEVVGALPRGATRGRGESIYFSAVQAAAAVEWLQSRRPGRQSKDSRRKRVKSEPAAAAPTAEPADHKSIPLTEGEAELAQQAREGRSPELLALERVIKLHLQRDPEVSPDLWDAAFDLLLLIGQTGTTSIFVAPAAVAERARQHQAILARACGGAVRIVVSD